jgi:DNA-binding NtrC family response regulator
MKQILLIDNEPAVCESFGIIFKDKHYLTACTDSRHALKAASEKKWDLVIFDAVMDGLNFNDIKSALKKAGCAPPVLVLTSPRTLKIAAEAVKQGASGYITKPIDVKEILIAADRALNNRGAPEFKNLDARATLSDAVNEFERRIITASLQANEGIQTRTADELGISRRVLKYKMDKLKIPHKTGKKGWRKNRK